MKEIKNKDNEKNILKKLDLYKKKDFSFSSGRILGSMCTSPHPIAKKAYMQFLETNLGDPQLFLGAKEIEKKYIIFLKKLLNAPMSSTAIIGSGGTESNIVAAWIAKKLSGKNEIIIPKTAHFSFDKIASLMEMKLVSVSVDDNCKINTSSLKKVVSNKTAMVLGIAGTTELGTIDPISDIADICYDEHVFFHVDAAFGGYVIPFLRALKDDIPIFDFKIKGICSIAIDAHKMGYSAIPLGTLILREKKWVESISVDTPYISSDKQTGLVGTRSGGPVAAAYAVAEYLGFNGYKELVRRCMDDTDYFCKKIKDLGLTLYIEPVMNVVAVKLKNPSKVAKLLTEEGWKVNLMKRLGCIRIVVMPHVTRKVINDFIPVFKKACIKAGENIS